MSAPGIGEFIGWAPDFEPPIDEDHHYLVVVSGNQTAGLWILHPGEHGLKIHANMLKGHRGDVATEAAVKVLDYGFKIADTIYAEVPAACPNVVAFTERFLSSVSVKDGVHLLMLRAEDWPRRIVPLAL